MTKKEYFNAVIENANVILATDPTLEFATGVSCTDAIKWAEHEIDLLSRKRSASSKPTKRQVENEALKGRIAEILGDEGMTVTNILDELNVEGLSNQRVSALMRQMVADGKAVKEMVKGKAMFTIA